MGRVGFKLLLAESVIVAENYIEVLFPKSTPESQLRKHFVVPIAVIYALNDLKYGKIFHD